MDFILQSGICGLVIALVTLLLALLALLFIGVTKSRRVAALFAVASFVPFLIGLSGTYLAEQRIEEELRIENALAKPRAHDHPDDEEVVGRQQAKVCSYLGLGSTALLLALCGLGVVVGRRPASRKA